MVGTILASGAALTFSAVLYKQVTDFREGRNYLRSVHANVEELLIVEEIENYEMTYIKEGRALIFDQDKKRLHIIDEIQWQTISSDKILDSRVEIEGNSMIIRQIELVISMEKGEERISFLDHFYGIMTGSQASRGAYKKCLFWSEVIQNKE